MTTRGRTGIARRLRHLASALPVALACAALWPSASQAFVGCTHSGTTLGVFATTDDDRVTVLRSGQAIFVLAGGDFGPHILLACVGGAPTVQNTDLISVENGPSDFAPSVTIDLSAGPMAPGATPEPDGTSEIEIRANATGRYGVFAIRGTEGSDTFHLGTTASGAPGINLNPAEETANPDADVEFAGRQLPVLFGRGGADTLAAQGAAGFAGPWTAPLFAAGGDGADAMGGGTGFNFFLGGDGRDRLFGSRGKDIFLPDAGRDRVATGAGPDAVVADEGNRDKINCGGGKDIALLDPDDKGASCKRVRGRGFNPELTEQQDAGIGATFEVEGF